MSLQEINIKLIHTIALSLVETFDCAHLIVLQASLPTLAASGVCMTKSIKW